MRCASLGLAVCLLLSAPVYADDVSGGAKVRLGVEVPVAPTPQSVDDWLTLDAVPARPSDGPTGSQFLARTRGWPEAQRQRAARVELERGNMPRALRQLHPVQLSYRPAGGATIQATIWVTPDYLAIGPEGDSVYIPLTRPSAAEVARRFGCVLPTPRIVDAIQQQAGARLEPRPLPAGPEMRSNDYYGRHQQLISAQRAGIPADTLLSGHKKDLVLTNRLVTRPDRVAIYGWYRPDGHPIQPLSTVHGIGYADYSHGVRLVWHEVTIDGAQRSIYDVLEDPALAPVLSNEGPLVDPRAIMGAPAPAFAAHTPAP